MRYATTTQPVWLKPWRSSVMATSEVLTIETSRFGRNMERDTLRNGLSYQLHSYSPCFRRLYEPKQEKTQSPTRDVVRLC